MGGKDLDTSETGSYSLLGIGEHTTASWWKTTEGVLLGNLTTRGLLQGDRPQYWGTLGVKTPHQICGGDKIHRGCHTTVGGTPL